MLHAKGKAVLLNTALALPLTSSDIDQYLSPAMRSQLLLSSYATYNPQDLTCSMSLS